MEAECAFEILIKSNETTRRYNAEDNNVNIFLRFSLPSFHFLLSLPNGYFLISFPQKLCCNFFVFHPSYMIITSYTPTSDSANTVVCDLCKNTKISSCNTTKHITLSFDRSIYFPQNFIFKTLQFMFFLLLRGQFSPEVKLKKICLWKRRKLNAFQDGSAAFLVKNGNTWSYVLKSRIFHGNMIYI
jgi:hypothetical protein